MYNQDLTREETKKIAQAASLEREAQTLMELKQDTKQKINQRLSKLTSEPEYLYKGCLYSEGIIDRSV